MNDDDSKFRTGSAGNRQSSPSTAKSESEILSREAAEAKRAMLAALDSLPGDLVEAADVRLWAKEHPWATLGMAAVVGFAAATILTPRRNESIQERMAKLATSARSLASAGEPNKSEARAGIGAALLNRLFDLAKVAVGNAILMAFQSGLNRAAGGSSGAGAAPRGDDVAETAHA